MRSIDHPIMMSSKENPASTVKILVLSKDGQASEKMRARLEDLPNIAEIQLLKESSDAKLTASAINKGNYNVVLMDENITSSPWEIIRFCSEASQKTPRFYVDGNVNTLLDIALLLSTMN